jgi:hypothetical protein
MEMGIAPRRVFAVALALAALPTLAPAAEAMGALADTGVTVAGSTASSAGTSAKPSASVSLEECLTASATSERSATFTGEMTAVPGSTKLEMRIEVLERSPHEALYHAVIAPGLGVWRSSSPGVKIFKYLKQVTNLSAPASYRGAVRFRWLNSKGKIVKALELRTPRCEQPLLAPREAPPVPAGGAVAPTQ